MPHIMLKGVGIFQLYENIDLGGFNNEKWYLNSFLQFTNDYTDIECGSFDTDIVDADYGVY